MEEEKKNQPSPKPRREPSKEAIEAARKIQDEVLNSPSMKAAIETARQFSDTSKRIFAEVQAEFPKKDTYFMTAPVPPPRPITARELDSILEKRLAPLEKKKPEVSSDIFLSYDRKNKELIREAGKTLVLKFSGTGKRRDLFEIIFDADGFVDTETLMEKTGSPSFNAVSKLTQGINSRVISDLKLKKKLIEGREGFGYRINPEITIHRQ